MSRLHRLGGTALALVTLAAPAAAAEDASPASPPAGAAAVVTLPEVTVSAARVRSLTVPDVEQQREALEETVGAVGFVDAAPFSGRYTADLKDVLRDAPGVLVATRYGQELRLSVRGSGIARAYHARGLEILQDGIPTGLADGSGDYYQIDPAALRSAEIYKGGNGLAYGASTMGGAVNFATPTAETALAPNLVRLYGGSFGTVQAAAQVSRVRGELDALASMTVTRSDGYRQHEAGQYEQLNANIGYRIAPDVETRFYLGAYVVDQQLPGTLSLEDALKHPRKASASALAGDQARNVRVERLANRTSFAFDAGQLDVDTWLIHKSLFHPIFQVIDQDGVTYGVAPRYTASLSLGGYRNDLIVGGRFFGGNNTALQFVNNGGSRGAQTLNARQDAYNYEAYLENRFFFLPDVALMTGVKLLHDERHYVDEGGLAADPIRKAASRSYDGINPKIGLLWQPDPDIRAFVDITRSQDVPDFGDLNQTIGATSAFVPLAAQHAWTAEVGTRGHHRRFAWDVAYYRSWVRDELLQFTTGPSIPASTFNAGRTLHQGIELGASVELLQDAIGARAGESLTIAQVWTWSDFSFRGDPQYGNNRIPGVAAHVLRTTLTYRRADGFYLAPSVEWVPEGPWADYANTLKVPGYVLLGLEAGIDLPEGWSVYLDARNLTDERYVSDFGPVTDARTANTEVFYPGAGRSVYAGIRRAF